MRFSHFKVFTGSANPRPCPPMPCQHLGCPLGEVQTHASSPTVKYISAGAGKMFAAPTFS